MQMGVDSTKDSDVNQSVTLLRAGLSDIEFFFTFLPQKHLPVHRGTNEPPRSWGQFDTGEEGTYDVKTFFNVVKFQKQAGLNSDDKAGRQTLVRLDEILVFLDGILGRKVQPKRDQVGP